MNTRTALLILTLAILSAAGGTFSAFAQKEKALESQLSPEGEPTMPEGYPMLPFRGDPMAFPGWLTGFEADLMAFEQHSMPFGGRPMPPFGGHSMPPAGGMPMAFGGPPMPFRGHPMMFMHRPNHFGKGGLVNPERLIEHVSAELELTEEQRAQLLPLLEERLSQAREHLRSRRDQNRQQFQEGGQKMWQELEQQLTEILTDEQMQKLREMKKNRMGRLPRSGFAGRPGAFQGPLRDLQLSQEQRQQIFLIVEKYRDGSPKKVQNFLDMHAAMMNILQQEEFDEQKARELFRQQTSQWEERFVERTKMLAEIKTVLSPEQVNMLQEKGANFIDMIERWHGAHQ